MTGRSCALLVISARAEEFDHVRDNFGYISFGSILSVILTVLQGSDNSTFAALGKEFPAQFAGLPPCDDIKEVGLAHALLIGETTLDGDSEGTDGDVRLSPSQFRIGYEIADQNHFIDRSTLPNSSLRWRLRSGSNPSGYLRRSFSML